MRAAFSVSALGGVFGVEIDDSVPADVRSAIVSQWAHLRADGVEPSERFRLVLRSATSLAPLDARTVFATSPQAAPDELAGALTLAGISRLAGEALMFHAAGLAYDDGGVAALIGPSGRGKTTACVRAGHAFGYVTDETVAVRRDLAVTPYPKPLSVGARPGTKALHAPADLGMKPAPADLHLTALVLLDRDANVASPQVEPVPTIDALADLVSQTSSLERLSRPLQTLLEVIDATGGVRRMRYSDADEVESLIPAIRDIQGVVEPWTVPSIAAIDAEVAQRAIARADYADAVILADRLVVLGSRRLHVLTGIGPTVWTHADGVSVEELRDRVIDEHGPVPPGVDATIQVDGAVDQLIEAGLLRRG